MERVIFCLATDFILSEFIHCGEDLEVEAAGVDGHAEGGVDVELLQFADVVVSGDAAGGGDFVGGGGAETAEPVEVCANL